MEFFEFTNVAQSLAALITGDPYYSFYWVCLIIGGVGFLAFFTLEAIALYTIAKNNGYKHRWMAFVPFFNTYYIGVLAEKNKTFGVKTKYFSLAWAIVEFVCVVLGILYATAVMLLFEGNYVNAIPESYPVGEEVVTIYTGKYDVTNLPENLAWAWWVFTYMSNYILSVLDLANLVLLVFVLSAFFRTYSPRNYMIFTIFSIFFPIKALFMVCLKNNKATNYIEYMRERQRRQYDAYQAYMRNNPNNGNYNGGYNGGGQQNNGGSQGQGSAPEDPFGGLGEQPGNNSKPSDDDPFGDLK